jgi:hypothetical protein
VPGTFFDAGAASTERPSEHVPGTFSDAGADQVPGTLYGVADAGAEQVPGTFFDAGPDQVPGTFSDAGPDQVPDTLYVAAPEIPSGDAGLAATAPDAGPTFGSPVEFALIPAFGLNALFGNSNRNVFALGLLAERSTFLDGFALAPVSLVDVDTQGLQIGGLAAFTTNSVTGAQLSAGVAGTSTLTGFQLGAHQLYPFVWGHDVGGIFRTYFGQYGNMFGQFLYISALFDMRNSDRPIRNFDMLKAEFFDHI